MLFTIATNSYQTTCTVSERSSIKGTTCQCLSGLDTIRIMTKTLIVTTLTVSQTQYMCISSPTCFTGPVHYVTCAYSNTLIVTTLTISQTQCMCISSPTCFTAPHLLCDMCVQQHTDSHHNNRIRDTVYVHLLTYMFHRSHSQWDMCIQQHTDSHHINSIRDTVYVHLLTYLFHRPHSLCDMCIQQHTDSHRINPRWHTRERS